MLQRFRSLLPYLKLFDQADRFITASLVTENGEVLKLNPLFPRSLLRTFVSSKSLYFNWFQSRLEYCFFQDNQNFPANFENEVRGDIIKQNKEFTSFNKINIQVISSQNELLFEGDINL